MVKNDIKGLGLGSADDLKFGPSRLNEEDCWGTRADPGLPDTPRLLCVHIDGIFF